MSLDRDVLGIIGSFLPHTGEDRGNMLRVWRAARHHRSKWIRDALDAWSDRVQDVECFSLSEITHRIAELMIARSKTPGSVVHADTCFPSLIVSYRQIVRTNCNSFHSIDPEYVKSRCKSCTRSEEIMSNQIYMDDDEFELTGYRIWTPDTFDMLLLRQVTYFIATSDASV